MNGSCCSSAECGAGDLCKNYSCTACTGNSECGLGRVCCGGGCQTGTCCTISDCTTDAGTGMICTGNVCTQCASDAECGSNSKCCGGACYPGVQCCSTSDCTGSRACIQGTCTSCTHDADCGGLMCCTDSTGAGRCQPLCQVTQKFSNKATFDVGVLDGGGVTTNGQPGFTPPCPSGALCWAGDTVTVSVPYIWIPATGEGGVFRYNTNTGARTPQTGPPFYTGVNPNWPTTPGVAPGYSPSRTSVNGFDATLWVANRGGAAPEGGVAHLDYDGRMICYGSAPWGPRAVAIDAAGDAWVGSYGTGTLYKFSGTELDPQPSNPRTCKLLLTLQIGGNPYGAATDNKNHVWVQDSGKIVEIDANTATVVHEYSQGAYGITVDKDYVWLTYCNGGSCRLNKSTGAVVTYPIPSISGIASTKDYVYTGSWAGVYTPAGPVNFGRIRKSDGAVSTVNVPAGVGWTISVAVDSADRIWAIDYYGPITRVNTDGSQSVFAGSPSGQYVYTDITGQQSINAGLTPGMWATKYDSQYRTPHWQKLFLTASTPTGTTVAVRVRASASKDDPNPDPNAWTPWYVTPPAANFPIDLATAKTMSNQPLPSLQYLEIAVRLTTSSDTTTPVVTSLSATWSPF